jgi:hypothetical protein
VHFFWGQLRPRGDALLRAGRRQLHPGGVSRPARCGHARGLFARGEQRRLLARQRRLSAGRLSIRTPIRRRPASPRPRSIRPMRSGRRTWASGLLPYERVPRRARPRGGAASLPAIDLPRRGLARQLGSGARVRARRSGAGRGGRRQR